MEGVGARLGRSSTRYGPATVFSGPVRKWKKKWIHVSSSISSNPPPSIPSNGNNTSHLLLYKWTPISQSNNNNSNGNSATKDDVATVPEEPPRRKFSYVPVVVIEEQKAKGAKVDEDEEPIDVDTANPSSVASRNEEPSEKPDMNDVPMEETQGSEKYQEAKQETNEANLDLSIGLKGHDDGNDPKTSDRSEGGQLERVFSGNSKGENRAKRKSAAPDLN